MRAIVFLLLAAALFTVGLPFLGDASISVADLWVKDSVGYRIFWELRVPRLILTLSAGGALAVLGVAYQIIFHNPLAEPYIMGVSSAVILGCVVAESLLIGVGVWSFGPVALGAILGLVAIGGSALGGLVYRILDILGGGR